MITGSGFPGIGPPEGSGPFLVVFSDGEKDWVDEFLFGLPDPAFQDVPGEDVEPDLDLVEPGGVGRREVEREPPALFRPFPDRPVLVGGEVVRDHMQVLAGIFPVQLRFRKARKASWLFRCQEEKSLSGFPD